MLSGLRGKNASKAGETRAIQFPQAAPAEDSELGAGQGTQEMGVLSLGMVAALRNVCESDNI